MKRDVVDLLIEVVIRILTLGLRGRKRSPPEGGD